MTKGTKPIGVRIETSDDHVTRIVLNDADTDLTPSIESSTKVIYGSMEPGEALAAAIAVIASVEPALDPDGSLQEDLWPWPTVDLHGGAVERLRFAMHLIEMELLAQGEAA